MRVLEIIQKEKKNNQQTKRATEYLYFFANRITNIVRVNKIAKRKSRKYLYKNINNTTARPLCTSLAASMREKKTTIQMQHKHGVDCQMEYIYTFNGKCMERAHFHIYFHIEDMAHTHTHTNNKMKRNECMRIGAFNSSKVIT